MGTTRRVSTNTGGRHRLATVKGKGMATAQEKRAGPLIGATIGLLTALFILIPYSIRAYEVARHITKSSYFGKPFWTSGPPGSLFPIPYEPGPLEVLTEVKDYPDLVIYALIDTNLFPIVIGLLVLLWSVAGLSLIHI